MKIKANSYHSQVNREKSHLKAITSDHTRASERFLKFIQHINCELFTINTTDLNQGIRLVFIYSTLEHMCSDWRYVLQNFIS